MAVRISGRQRFHLQRFSPEKRSFEPKKELCKELLLTWNLQGKTVLIMEFGRTLYI